MWPYTPLHAVETDELAAACPQPSGLNLLVANVLMTNRRSEPLLALIGRLDPDVILLVETDGWWDERLAPVKARYPHRISHPREDYYGLHLFSRFPLVEPTVRFLIDEYVPSIRTGLRLPSGALVDFHGVHPKPPPHHDTARRDAELLITAREAHDTKAAPSIVAGDLNDVAWSRTTRLFQEIGGLLDPRVGRGPHSTYNANWPLLRWPLDHVFFEPPFRLVRFAVESHIGSDHFPFFVALCHLPGSTPPGPRPDPEPSDLERAREAIREGREEARERR
jgi:endonuclease/exonuclease/phosphatase (EEP) superfamily protein YafD